MSDARARRGRRPHVLIAMLVAICSIGVMPASTVPLIPALDGDPVDFVDPMIGTLGSGFVFPGPAAPYGMVQLSPDTDGVFAYTGYQWIDAFIRGFSHVHVQSMGVREGGNIPFMPTAGPILSTDVERYKSLYTHLFEEAEAGYYSVKLLNYGIDVELTAGLRAGMHRYTFPPGLQQNVMLDIGRQIPGGDDNTITVKPGTNLASIEILPDQRTVIGSANVDLKAEDHYPVHFAARFDRPFASYGVWPSRGAPVQDGVASIQSQGAGAVVSFAPDASEVLVKTGISFTSPAAALANLESELPGDDFDFDALRARTRDAWSDALGAITVEGGTPLDKTSFYTALYHAQHHPNVFDDAAGTYLGHDGSVHTVGAPGDPMPAGSTYYANFSLWDTYRAEMPLLMMIAPDRMRDMMRSWRAILQQGGRLPRWSLMNRHADFMNGEPALQSLADAYCRGLVPDEVLPELYADAARLALEDRRDPVYLELGYIPLPGSGASGTLEHAIGDFALALMADRLGETADRDQLLTQAGYWRNQFDPETRFMRPRNADGTWMTPYHPELPEGWREGTGWQYSWLVPQDVAGLLDAMGRDTAQQRLDTFFLTPVADLIPYLTPEVQQKLSLYGIAYYGNQYAPSNEHDLQAPYLYDWTSQPWKTQSLSRAYQTLYRATPDGLPGNDDLGTMSAWFVWSALGFYPTIPGSPVYTIGSPLFERATIRLPGGTFTVDAPGTSLASKYIGSATLNGSPLDATWFTHDAITPGGSINFAMSPTKNAGWAAGPGAAPPSMSANPLADFACTP
ncbi:MAG: GH92 family glycosyl hydrolase [Actinomycetota bacterium]